MQKSTRENILAVAAQIISREGLDEVSIRHVCKKASVQAPTVYHHFKNKEGLLEAVIDLAYDEHISSYSKFLENNSALEGLEKTWDSFFKFVEKEPDLFNAIVIAHLKRRIPQKGIQLFENIAEIFKRLEETQGLKLPYRKAAQIFYATAYGQALVYVSQKNNPTLKANIRFTRDMCIQSLLA